jgi:hypothetical protein
VCRDMAHLTIAFCRQSVRTGASSRVSAAAKLSGSGEAAYICSSRSRPPMAAETLAMNAPIKSANAE